MYVSQWCNVVTQMDRQEMQSSFGFRMLFVGPGYITFDAM